LKGLEAKVKEFFGTKGLLAWMGILLMAAPAQGLPTYAEVDVQGHRCLVVDPPDLAPGAPVVLILHGFGTGGYELLSLCEELQLPPCRFVLPDAPLPIDGYPSAAHAWYGRFTHSRKDIVHSRDYLFAVMELFSNESPNPPASGRPHAHRPVVIMGFSQGAVMSLEAGLNYKGPLAAIVSMSGYIGEPGKTLAHPSAPFKTPILLVNGTADPVVQDDMTHETVKALRRAGYHPVLRELPIGHHLTPGAIAEASSFLQKVFGENR
jgi:phospholipase/carboxylesterase